ncbi:hypothetical protein PISL3812_01132 [Talaromyces islandicus]|uniref:Box C/D snoRNA protein 1 n=1 Tax=Talaromyces islandicus TaxID=28573 RepID=A0A0U1LMZ0_TALIS|nr:hypothetical protein PISL3812_01132 [Talaromyces islandicus]
MSEPLLSELCTICHTTPPKYTCPRCAIRTCSLACARRHKNWSQCSGVRDPAAYATRAELQTASALDRDFNFITGVERGLERAEREARARGFVDLDHEYMQDPKNKRKRKRRDGSKEEAAGGGGAGGSKKLVKGELAFLRAAQDAGVKVERSPRGMTRNKENKSRFHPKHKCLSWTVDWIHTAGRSRVVQNYLETITIGQAYDRAYPPLPDEATSTPKEENKTEPFPPHRNIYIYIRRQADSHIVLAPLHPEAKLADVLRGRTVYEYPRLYVKSESPADIESGAVDETHVLEETWLRNNPTGIEAQDDDESDWTSSEGSSEESEDDDESETGSDSDSESESQVSDVKEETA